MAMGLFGRNDSGATGDDVVWQDCPGCTGTGEVESKKSDKDGNTHSVFSKCGGCKGSGSVPGGNR